MAADTARIVRDIPPARETPSDARGTCVAKARVVRPFALFLVFTFGPALLFACALAGCDPARVGAMASQDDSTTTGSTASGASDEGFDAATPVGYADDDGGIDATLAPPSWTGDDDDDIEDATSPPASPPFDAGVEGTCEGGLGPGDLAIVEILVASLAGTGDHGEWLEVRSTRDCALDLAGLHGECAVGAKVTTVDVLTDVWLPARGSFVLADSTDPAVNHSLPGFVLGWSGDPGDVLRNQGTTVTLLASGALIDSVTYPTSKAPDGVSLSFPSDCPPALRSDWTRWELSTSSWFPGFRGTPNASNDDVQCPDD